MIQKQVLWKDQQNESLVRPMKKKNINHQYWGEKRSYHHRSYSIKGIIREYWEWLYAKNELI